jgi:hypothetical protein
LADSRLSVFEFNPKDVTHQPDALANLHWLRLDNFRAQDFTQPAGRDFIDIFWNHGLIPLV